LQGETVGPYRLVSELGSGGMGTVYLAEATREHAGLLAGDRVAVKVILPRLLEDPAVIRRFRREAEIGAAVRHPNVVRTLDVGSEQRDGREVHYLVMEFVRGQTLRALLQTEGALPEKLCRHVGREVARGLDAVHAAGAVHRDLKPENILITHEQEVRLMDLGVARLRDEATRLTRTGAFVGSLNYAAPEQISEGGAVDGRADLFALGVVLHEAASGSHPFGRGDWGQMLRRVLLEPAPRLSASVPGATPFFEEVVRRLLAKDREERFPSAREVYDVLEEGEACTWWRCGGRALRGGGRRPARRVNVPRDTPLFGREPEIERLLGIFGRVREGRGQVVLLEGEAGIGKTRLVDELVGRLAADGEEFDFLFGSYPPLGAAAAAGAIAAAFRDHLGAEGLEEALRERLRAGPDVLAGLAAFLRGDSQPRGGEPISRDELAGQFVRLARSLAQERPLVILADDLHFAPEHSRALFGVLALAAADMRVLLVGTARQGLPRDWVAGLDRFEHATRLTLPRLGPRDLSRLLEAALGSRRLAGELGLTVARKSDGNPFFVLEILRGLREGRFLSRQEDGSWVKTRVIEDVRIPSSILDLIQARIGVLDEVDRDLLDVAACCGYEFDPLLVGEVVGMAPIPVLKRLGRLEREHRLVRSTGVRCVFDHHQVQEALYENLSELLRREYHGALAAALEVRAGGPERDPEDVEGSVAWALADHFFRADRGDRALRYVDRALDFLEESHLNDAAVDLAGRVHSVPGLLGGEGRLRILIRKAERLELLGRREEERRTLEEALRAADEGGDAAAQASVRRRLGRHLCLHANHGEAHEVLKAALDFARRSGNRREEGAALGALGVVCWHLGRYEEARTFQERTQAVAEELGGLETDFTSTGNLPELYAELGRMEDAIRHVERSLAIARETGDRRAEAVAMGNLGGLRYDRGELLEAREAFERALDLAREVGDRRGEARAAGNLGRVLRDLGRTAEAREVLEGSLALAKEIGYLRGEARALGHLARVDRDLGCRREARVNLERYLLLARQMEARREEAHALRDLAVLAAEEGDRAAAERGLQASLAACDGSNHLAGRASIHLALGRLFAGGGRTDEAVRHLGEASALAAASGAADEAVLAAAALALLPGGDPAAAARTYGSLSPRLRLPERMEAAHMLWSSTGDPTLLAEARRLAGEIRDHAPAHLREALGVGILASRTVAGIGNATREA
jgi:tetratricopeptide (TPR) repeat protein